MISLEIIIWVLVLMAQLVLAIFASWQLHQSKFRFDIFLSSQIHAAELLIKYARIVKPISIKVNARIGHIALLHKDILWMNRDYVYLPKLRHTVAVINELVRAEMGKYPQQWLWMLSLVFLVEIGCGIYGSIISNRYLIIVAIVISFMLFIAAIFAQRASQSYFHRVWDLAVDLLDLDKLEKLKLTQLLEIKQGEVLTYPLWWIQELVSFIVPRKY